MKGKDKMINRGEEEGVGYSDLLLLFFFSFFFFYVPFEMDPGDAGPAPAPWL